MRFDFNDRPFIVIWEVTRACSLACRHCRAEANSRRHPLELNTAESFNLIEQVARCRPVLFVMTGGDPYYSTLFTPFLIYEEAFDRFRFGQGAVIMLITFVLTAYLLYTLFQLSKGWGYADET